MKKRNRNGLNHLFLGQNHILGNTDRTLIFETFCFFIPQKMIKFFTLHPVTFHTTKQINTCPYLWNASITYAWVYIVNVIGLFDYLIKCNIWRRCLSKIALINSIRNNILGHCLELFIYVAISNTRRNVIIIGPSIVIKRKQKFDLSGHVWTIYEGSYHFKSDMVKRVLTIDLVILAWSDEEEEKNQFKTR